MEKQRNICYLPEHILAEWWWCLKCDLWRCFVVKTPLLDGKGCICNMRFLLYILYLSFRLFWSEKKTRMIQVIVRQLSIDRIDNWALLKAHTHRNTPSVTLCKSKINNRFSYIVIRMVAKYFKWPWRKCWKKMAVSSAWRIEAAINKKLIGELNTKYKIQIYIIEYTQPAK